MSQSAATTPATTTDTNQAASTTPSSTVNSDQTAAPATENSATATAGQNADQSNGQAKSELPQTASPLPLLGLLGFSSLLGGLFARRK